MSVASYLRERLRLQGRIALLFGIGAISTVSTTSEAVPVETGGASRIPQQSDKVFGDLRVWSDGGKIYLREAGGAALELTLSDTPEAMHLRKLLDERGAVADSPQVLQHRIILVGSGGEGFHWPADNSAPAKTPSPTSPADPAGQHTRGNPARPADPGDPGALNRTSGGQAN